MLLWVLISGVRTPTLEKVFYKYFNHLEVFSNKSIYFLNQYWIIFVSDVTETSKEVLAGLKMLLTFLSPAASPSQFYFFRIKVTLLYSSYFCQKKKKKKLLRFFLKNFGWRYFAIFVIKPQSYVKLCLKTEIAPFLQKM